MHTRASNIHSCIHVETYVCISLSSQVWVSVCVCVEACKCVYASHVSFFNVLYASCRILTFVARVSVYACICVFPLHCMHACVYLCVSVCVCAFCELRFVSMPKSIYVCFAHSLVFCFGLRHAGYINTHTQYPHLHYCKCVCLL